MKYSKPTINVTAERLNNWEDQTTLSISGTYERLTINNEDKNIIQNAKYRYRESGGTWRRLDKLNLYSSKWSIRS